MRQNFLLASTLALLTTAFATAQTIVPLNVLPTRVVGHGSGAISPLTGFPNLIEGRELWQPQGIAVDTSVTPNILYVSDSLNNRVLAWRNAQGFRNGEKANLVIGQSDFFRTSAGGPGSSFSTGLNAPSGLVVDRSGSLYVADQVNNRVLRYPRPFDQPEGNVLPDMVIGQPNFSRNDRAMTETGLSLANATFLIGLALDGQGNLWVVDGGNRRVLRYSAADLTSGANGPRANLVIGSENFTSVPAAVTQATRTTANAFANPGAVAVDAAGRVYVSDIVTDRSQSRVLVFAPPFANGHSAARMMSVFPTPLTSEDTFNKAIMAGPSAIFFLPGNRMGVIDALSHRILIFDAFEQWPDAATSFSPLATAVFGQTNFAGRNSNAATGTFNPPPTSLTLSAPLGAAIAGSELFVADTGNNRVVALPLVGSSFAGATRVLGQDGFTTSGINLVEGREFSFRTTGTVAEAGLALDETGDVPHLYVADTFNNRVLGYRDFRKVKAGAPFDKADIIIGQPDFSSNMANVTGNPDALTASTLFAPMGVMVDSKGDLWVADTGNGRVLRFPAPFARPAQQPAADVVLGQRNFTSKITDPGRSTMAQPYGLTMNSQGLFVSDALHHRVLLFEFGAGSAFSAADNGKAALKVFGQPDFLTATSGNGDDKMASPRHLSADNEGRIYIADSGNNRVLIYSDVATAAQAGSRATFQIGALAQPRGIFVNGLTGEFWVAEANSGTLRRYPRYGNLILGQQSLCGTAQNPCPSAAGSTLAVAQDQYGDLVVADSTNRIGVYYPAMQAINGASFLPGRSFLAPGMLASLCSPGSNCAATRRDMFGAETVTIIGTSNPFPMPRTLGDVEVLFNGEPTPLYTVTPGQINFVVPMKAPTTGVAELQVIQPSTGRVYAATPVAMNSVNPAILMLTYEGTNRQAAVVNLPEGTVNGPNTPAKRGSYVQIYATGQGFVAGAPEDGEVISGVLPTSGQLRVNIGGTYLEDFVVNPADRPKSEWVASALSAYPGLWVINVWIPSAVPANAQVPIFLSYNSAFSIDPNTIRTTIAVGN
jgi:uncharacterized protein (TIGR03437 family)